MKNFFLDVENMWSAMHCTSTLIDSIALKRYAGKSRIKKQETYESVVLDSAFTMETNIKNFSSIIGNSSLQKICDTFIRDIYRFDFFSISSVTGTKDINLNYNLEIVKSVNLIDHSFGTFNLMFEIVHKKYGLYSDFFYIAALLHDFGKSRRLKEAYAIDLSLEHHKASSEYLKLVYVSEKAISPYHKKMLGVVSDVLSAHHSPSEEKLFYSVKGDDDNHELQILLLEKLKEADIAQRKKEELEAGSDL